MLTLSAQLNPAGNVRTLVEATMTRIRKDPGNADLRVMLFQLYCLTGDWQRALGQLVSAATLDSSIEEMARAYREVIRCEVYRGKVFAGSKVPLFLGEPDIWLAKLLESLRLVAAGSLKEAGKLRAEALSLAPPTPGCIGEHSFEWIADMDSRLGPVIEAMINGKYYWIPFHQLKSIEIEQPVDMRDLVWAPARLIFAAGGEQVAFLPVRYPGTETHGDDDFLLARKTDWQEVDDETCVGVGQRMLVTDTGEFSLLDTRHIELNSDVPH